MRKQKRKQRTAGLVLAAGILLCGCGVQGAEERRGQGQRGEDAAKRYEETGVSLPEAIGSGTETIAGTAEEDGALKLFALVRGDAASLASYSFRDGEWSRQEERWGNSLCAQADQERITAFQGEDGQYYAWYIAAGERPHLAEKTGEESYQEILIPSWEEKIEGTDYVLLPEQAAVLKNGNIVITSRIGAFLYDRKNGNEILKEMDYADWGLLNCSGSQIFGNIESLTQFSVYDTEAGETVSKGDNGGRSFSAFYRNKEGTIYGCGRDGVYQWKEEAWTRVFSGESNSLSDPSMLAEKLFEKDGVFYILYRSNQNEELGQRQEYRLKRYALDETAEQEGEGGEGKTFTVWSVSKNSTVEYALQLMRERHPEITFRYWVASDQTAGAATLADEIRNLNTELVSGQGPDLVLLDGLDSQSYIEKGMLLELSGMLERAGGLKEGVLESFRSPDGGIYEIPIRFQVPMIFTVQRSLSGAATLEELNRYMENGPEVPLFPELTLGDALEVGFRFFCTDLFREDGTVDGERLENFLEDMKRFTELNKIVEKTQRTFSYTDEEPWDSLLFREAAVLVKNVSSLSDAQSVLDAVLQCGGEYHAAAESFIPAGRASIPQNAQHREESEELLELLLSPEVQAMDFKDGFPVSEEAMESWGAFQSDTSIMIGDENGQEITAGCASPEQIKAFLESVSGVNRKFIVNEELFGLVKQKAEEYLRGNVGREQTVHAIQNQLSVYSQE